MCGRYTLMLAQDELEDRFGARFASDGEQFSPRYNMAPGQHLPVITDETPTTIRELEWGLVPTWADDASGGIINARAETVDEKPSFRDAYRQATVGDAEGVESAEMEQDTHDRKTPAAGRCLVPADGFYEWVETDDGK